MKPNNNSQEALRWLGTSEHDLRAARWNRDGGFFDTACFHAQQAAEKALKSFLLALGERNVRSHSAVS
jgi:HEPN domain-containing protein